MCKEEKDSREINSAILQILQQHLLYQDHFVLHNQQCMLCRPHVLSEFDIEKQLYSPVHALSNPFCLSDLKLALVPFLWQLQIESVHLIIELLQFL